MGNYSGGGRVSNKSVLIPRSESKLMAGQKMVLSILDKDLNLDIKELKGKIMKLCLAHKMENALSEKELQLENWLNQVKEMQLQCDCGISDSQCTGAPGMQQPGSSENACRIENSKD